MLLSGSAAAAPVWELGKMDDSAAEFWSYDSGEFKTSSQIRRSDNYDAATQTFTCRIPAANGVIANPAMPGGLSGSGAGNYSIVRRLRLIWQEPADGWRNLEYKVIPNPNAKDFSRHRLTPNENMDIDGMTWVSQGLVTNLPGRRQCRQELPLDLKSNLEKNKQPLIISAVFPVKKGENTIEIYENSGDTYGRLYAFDYLKLTEVAQDVRPRPEVDFGPHQNFINSSVYQVGNPAKIRVNFYNLEPDKTVTVKVIWLDYFDRQTVVTPRLQTDHDGCAEALLEVPAGQSGHFRIRASLSGEQNTRESRIAGVRKIEPLDESEVKHSFLGLCGQSYGTYFDPAQAPEFYRRKAAEYREWRNILQIRHERIHSLCWHFVEPAPGGYRWQLWDELIAGEKADNISVQLCLLGTPKFLLDQAYPGRKYQHLAEQYFSPPPDMQKWAEFCRLTAQRYGDYVKEFELWNEVSEQSLFWHQGNLEQFYQLIKTGSEAIRQARPDAKVVAETLWSRQEEFTRRLFELGVAQYVDIHADHYLTDDRIHLDAALIAKYAPGSPFMSNENKAERSENPLGQIDEVSRRAAADSLLRNTLFANANGFTRLYNFMLTGSTWRMWGMVGPDDTPKYTFSAYKTMVNQTAGASFEYYAKLSNRVEMFVYRYNRRRTQIHGSEYLVVLTNRGAAESIALPAAGSQITVTDLMDNPQTLDAAGGIAQISLASSPVFLHNIDVSALKAVSELKIEPVNPNLRPGDQFTLRFSLGGPVKQADFTVSADGQSKTVSLTGNQPQTVGIPTPDTGRNTVGQVKVAGVAEVEGRKIPVTRYFNYYVEDQLPGVSLLPPLAKDNFRKWAANGTVELTFVDGKLKAAVDAAQGSGAVCPVKPAKVIAGCRYLLGFEARGVGILRVMLNRIDANGKGKTLTHNFLSEKLEDNFISYAKEWLCPDDVETLSLDFYQYHTQGNFELRNLRLIRLQDELPVNRQLHRATAKRFDGKGAFPEFAPDQFTGVDGTGYLKSNEGKPVSANFAAMYDSRKLYICVKVKDAVEGQGPSAANLWEGDSVQLDFDLSDGMRKVRTVQLGFAKINGRDICYRYSTLPAEDIVNTYKIGENPTGVDCKITRQNDMVTYRITIAAEAVHPQLQLLAGKTLGFSLLVNNNDGAGRLGFLEWSGGIGAHQDNTRFGELKLLP